MNNINPNPFPALERTLYASKEAGTFDVYAPRWVLSFTQPKGLSIPNLNEWPTEQKEALLRTLAERATKYQNTTIENEIAGIKAFTHHFAESDDFPESGIDVENLLIWFTACRHVEDKLKIRRLVQNIAECGYSDVFEEGVLSLTEQYNGKRIRLHPERFEASRSFTESERKQLYYQLARESLLGNIPFTVRVVATLILITGKRPIQITNSKFMDFSLQEVSLAQGDKRNIVLYNAPVAKQKGQTFRSQFNTMPIVSSFEIWADLEQLKASYIEKIKKWLDIDLTDDQALLLPILMPTSKSDIIERFEASAASGLDIFLRSDRIHLPNSAASAIVRQLNNHISLLSDYSGRPLTINAKRFRHTRATNLALSGASIEEITDALDHSDNRTAAEYVDNLPTRAVRIGYQVEDTLGVLAKKFMGINIENSDKVINLYTKNGTHNVGVCGMESFCSDNYPISCYECELFNPNPLGNHAAVQEYIETQLQEAKENGDSRLIENWHTILLAVLERRYIADQQRLQMLNEAPEALAVEPEREPNE
jgi:integrase